MHGISIKFCFILKISIILTLLRAVSGLHLELEKNILISDDFKISKYMLKGTSSLIDESAYTGWVDQLVSESTDFIETTKENDNCIWLSHEDEEHGHPNIIINV
jgi:hypothetical protein